MKLNVKYILCLAFIHNLEAVGYAQEKEFEQIALTPKTVAGFPSDYKMLRPRLAVGDWDDDHDVFYNYSTPTLKKTQSALTGTYQGVFIAWTPNSIMGHAQLDTNTIIKDPAVLTGTWRMIVFRSIRFNDSIFIPTRVYYRLADSVLHDKSKDEAFAVFDDNNFKLYAREVGESRFKKEISSKYSIEGKRYIMLYKFAKAVAGVSQIGIDEKGYLIMNYARVIEHIKKNQYFSYYSIIDQYIFEKVR